MKRTGFAFAQARLQARHGERPPQTLWRRLDSAGDFANYLDAVRRTPLNRWVEGLHSGDTGHVLETRLRQRMRHYTLEVAHWLPAPWQEAIAWMRHLPELPALQYLLSGEPAPPWMHDDDHLNALTDLERGGMLDALAADPRRRLLEAWQPDRALHEVWSRQWRQRWPRQPKLTRGLRTLDDLLLQALAVQQHGEAFDASLVHLFRRESFKPAAAAAHLALVALDVERLRGELLLRALFPRRSGVAA